VNFDACPNVVIQELIDETKEEVKQFVEMAKRAEAEGDQAGAQAYKLQMMKQIEFLRSAQKALLARGLT